MATRTLTYKQLTDANRLLDLAAEAYENAIEIARASNKDFDAI